MNTGTGKKSMDKSFWLGWHSIIAFEKAAENRFSMDSSDVNRTSGSFFILAPLRSVFIPDISELRL